MTGHPNNLALVLGGGGARAAYQVGLLRSVAKSCPDLRFPILTGVSAGAINTAFLANHADGFPSGVEQLAALWEQMTVDKIFRTDTFALAETAFRWGMRLVSGGARLAPKPRGLVNTAPLRRFLRRVLNAKDGTLRGVQENIRTGRLKAVGITTTDYATEQSITWVDGRDVTPWQRPQRRSVAATLTVEHVMASCALPLFFPAIRLDNSWHGDGGVRLVAPLSPALHFGAERIFVVSTRYQKSQQEADRPVTRGYPAPATVLGVMLNAVFLDMVDYDALLMQRINRLLAAQPAPNPSGLRPVELLTIRPSQDLTMLAADYEADLPRAFRYLVRGLGTRETERPHLLATILFAPEYIRRLIRIGEEDGEKRRDEIRAFLQGA